MARKRINCEIADEELENEHGRLVPGVVATCSVCGLESQCFGQGGRSVRRALMLLREDCPNGGHGFYMTEDERTEED